MSVLLRFAVGTSGFYIQRQRIQRERRKKKLRQNIFVMNSGLIKALSMDDSWILITFNYFSTAHASFHQEFQSMPTD